jgi:hypothetical protein
VLSRDLDAVLGELAEQTRQLLCLPTRETACLAEERPEECPDRLPCGLKTYKGANRILTVPPRRIGFKDSTSLKNFCVKSVQTLNSHLKMFRGFSF